MQQMDSQRSGCTVLGVLCLSKFSYKQTKTLEQLERVSLPQSENRSSLKFYEINLSHTFGSDTLITNFQICLNDQNLWKSMFQFCLVEANCLSNRGHYMQMNNLKVQKNQNFILIDAVAFSQSLKFILNLKKDFHIYCEDIITLKKQKTKNIQQQNITKVLTHVISSIKIYGFNLHASPSPNQLTKLLNISQGFKKNKRYQEQAESDILLALCLINARRFIQASELLRKTSNYFVKKYNSSKSHLDLSKYERSWVKDCQEQNFTESLNMSRNYSTGRVLEGAKYLFKAAKIQLLLAQTISHPSLRSQRLQAYNRSNSYFNGNPAPTPLQPNIDIEQILFKIGPNLLAFLMKVLYDKAEILRIAALKAIQFIYETVGCSLSQMIHQLLKTILVTYPSNQSQQILNINSKLPQSLETQRKDQKVVDNQMAYSKNKTLIDSYHHLLETLIGLIPLMNKKYIRSIFKDILVPNLSNNNVSIKNQLRLYLLRSSQKIMSICLSDLQISTSFLSGIITLSQKRIPDSSSSSKYTIHNISFFAQRLIQLFKVRILPRYDKQEDLVSLASWVNENLVYFCQNEITPENMPFFSLLIDFIVIIYSRKIPYKLPYPIQPILYFLNMSIHQLFLPFENLLKVTIILLNFIKFKNGSCEISSEIVGRVLNKAKLATLNIKQLKILQSVLGTFENIQIELLILFLECIPHSTFDQIYSVFSILFQKSLQNINKSTLQKIIDTLLDQYTVKGKAHQLCKNQMMYLIKTKKNSLIKYIFEICLTQNSEPVYQNYEARKKRIKQHTIDTKLYKIHYQLFIEKLQLLILFLSKNEAQLTEVYKIFSSEFIKNLYYAIKKLMQSNSSKIKQKGLRIIKNLNQIVSNNIKIISKLDLFYTKATISLLRNFIVQQIQSKLQYQAIVNISIVFNQILKPHQNHIESTEESEMDFMDGNIESHTQFQALTQNLQAKISDIRFRQFVKIYPALVNLLNSPWENIKELIIETIVQFFSKGLMIYSENYQRKAVEVLKPLLLNYLQSSDYFQRYGACKIIGCLIGLSKEFKSREEISEFLFRSTRRLKIFMTQIFNIQQDWHQTTSKISKLIIQVSLTLQQQDSLKKRIQSWKKTQQMMESSYCSFNLNDQYNTFENKFEKNASSFSINNFQNLENLLKDNSRYEEQIKNESRGEHFVQVDQKLEQQIGHFKAEVNKNHYLRTSFFGDKQSFIADRQQQNYLQPNEDKAESFNDQAKQNKTQDEPLEFEDLGIIDLDDQQWGEQENQVQITQKLPLKKIYKLSPNVGSSSKHQLIRSKRYSSHEFDPNDKIIVDQLEGKINNQSKQPLSRFKPQSRQKFQPKQKIQRKIEQKNQRFIGKKQRISQNYEDFQESEDSQVIKLNQSVQLKVESREQFPEQKSIQKTQQRRPGLQRTSVKKKVKKSTKKRKSSILN